MVTILVDYENVCGKYGLTGAEYLTEKDSLCIFYSKSKPNIRKEDISHIEESGCEFNICELDVPRKNALDFYIATEAGIAYQTGSEFIILVSGDQGFHSVSDYFKIKGLGNKLIVAPTIEKGLLQISDHEKTKRGDMLKRNEKLKLSAEYARINERRAIKESIIECLSGTEYADDLSRVLACIDKVGTSSKKDLYRGSLHEFGRASGTKIYNMVKQVV